MAMDDVKDRMKHSEGKGAPIARLLGRNPRVGRNTAIEEKYPGLLDDIQASIDELASGKVTPSAPPDGGDTRSLFRWARDQARKRRASS